MAQMKNLIFEKNIENEKIIDDLLEKDNLEMRTYAFNIILSELEKNSENNNQEIQLAINAFIDKNLEKIINNFDDYINNLKEEIKNDRNYNNKENTQFIQFLNYYHVNIQIILFSLKRLINDSNLFEFIQKFDDINIENKEESIISFVSNFQLKEQILQKFNFEKLFDIVISFLNIQKEQIKTVIYDIKFSFNIILLIFILLEKSSDNDINKIKEIIYNNYISNIVNLSKSHLIKCKRLL